MPSLLNHEKISTQLRDWKQIAEQKALASFGSTEGAIYLNESKRYALCLEHIEGLLEEIRVVRANHAQLLKDFDARNEVIEELQRDCAEAYQVIGALGGDNLVVRRNYSERNDLFVACDVIRKLAADMEAGK